MSYVNLEVRKAERVGVMTLNYNQENRFHPDFVAEMMEKLDAAEKDPDIGALVVTGSNPKFFCNGLDLDWLMANATDTGAVFNYLKTINAMYKRWTLYPKPVVAALNGHTYAGGVFMAGHMDFRFMREDRGWVCLPEATINIPLLPGMIAICQAVMTSAGFRHLYYTGSRVTSREAMSFGFVDAVYPEAELLPKSIEFAAGLAGKRQDTYAEMKLRIRGEIARILDEDDPPMFGPTLAFPMKG
jgi:Delta3-Delta2-enoyl-CoA isomerase